MACEMARVLPACVPLLVKNHSAPITIVTRARLTVTTKNARYRHQNERRSCEPSNRGSASVSNEDGKPNPATTRIVGVLGLIALGLAFYTITGGFKSSSNKSSVAKSNNIVADKIEEVTGMNVSGISDMTNIDWGSEEEKAVNKAAVLALLEKMKELETARLKMQEVGATSAIRA